LAARRSPDPLGSLQRSSDPLGGFKDRDKGMREGGRGKDSRQGREQDMRRREKGWDGEGGKKGERKEREGLSKGRVRRGREGNKKYRPTVNRTNSRCLRQ